MRFKWLLILLVFLTSCEKSNDDNENLNVALGPEGQKLDSLLTPYINDLRWLTDNQAGLAIGVSKGDGIIYAHSFGYADLEKKEKVNANTLFHVASVSKPFVAFAIAKLIEQKKVSLEDKIVELIPAFEMKGTGYKDITVQHILNHTSGIPANLSPDDWTNPSFGDSALAENILAAKEHELLFEPGSQFSYSNSAYDILGLVIKRVSGMPFSEYINSYVLEPAGMLQSTYEKPSVSSTSNWAKAYSYGVETQEWQPYPYNEKLFPSSGLVTNLNDMMEWAQLHLGKGIINGDTILQENYFKLLLEHHFETPWGDSIGLSWFLQSYMDRPIIMHQGQDTGFESIVYLYPEENVSIVVLANRDFSRTGRIINAASEVLFGSTLKDYTISAKYKFAEAYKQNGIEQAKLLWAELKTDTTDRYHSYDGDVLRTGSILENAGEWKATKEVLEYYNTLNDRSTYSWRLLGNANPNLGDTLKALSNYKKCLEINPKYVKASLAIEKIQNNKN